MDRERALQTLNTMRKSYFLALILSETQLVALERACQALREMPAGWLPEEQPEKRTARLDPAGVLGARESAYVTALRNAGTDKDVFDLSFTHLRGEADAGFVAASKIAAAYLRRELEASENALGAIETRFYAQRKTQVHANGQANGGKGAPR